MQEPILNYLICPAQTPRCSFRICDEDERETLSCECGRKYKKIEGVYALRPIDEGSAEGENNLPMRSRYYDESFVGMFLLRQFGPLVRFAESFDFDFSARAFSRMAEIRHGGELFYQSLLNAVLPYLREDSVVLDIGCGTGRLTGELAQRGIRFAIGLDYSPVMAVRATMVINGERGKRFNLTVRSSRTKLHKASVLGWGLENCAFAVADAHALPIPQQSIDSVACINLLHRVKNPKRVIQEICRVIRQEGILLVSNSYDWDDEYTPPELWFDDFLGQLDPSVWKMEGEIDGVPYLTGLHNRKLSLTFNHIQVFRKLT